jgi:hypothetical protein
MTCSRVPTRFRYVAELSHWQFHGPLFEFRAVSADRHSTGLRYVGPDTRFQVSAQSFTVVIQHTACYISEHFCTVCHTQLNSNTHAELFVFLRAGLSQQVATSNCIRYQALKRFRVRVSWITVRFNLDDLSLLPQQVIPPRNQYNVRMPLAFVGPVGTFWLQDIPMSRCCHLSAHFSILFILLKLSV